jgi:hypothetical protein
MTFSNNGVHTLLEVAPFITDGRTMVPFRAIATALGAEVDWEEPTRTVIFLRDGITRRLPVGTPLLNQVGEYMGTPVIVDGRTLVPLQYVSVAFGAEVRWDPVARAIYIYE